MKNGKRRFLAWMLCLAIAALAFYILTRNGLNPVLSVLAILYWKTIIALGIISIGLAYYSHTIIH